MNQSANFYDYKFDELSNLVAALGEPSYRAGQLWNWLYKRFAIDFDQMTDLPAEFRQQLSKQYMLRNWKQVAEQESTDGQTKKTLLLHADGEYVEVVLMRYEKRRTLCISTQAGCAMGCVFCATGQMGFNRNLSPGEIVGQVIHYARILGEEGQRVTNIVMMGMGEPLHNYESTMKALDLLTDQSGFNLGARKITISTVGLVPAIRRYADEGRQTPLAVSLHAASDEERNELIPINRRWPLSDLMDACRYYIQKSGRRLTFEWALIEQKNDTLEQARRLGHLVKGMLCHVNLIPLNPTAGFGESPSSRERVDAFQRELARYGVSSTVRVRRGIDIQAGCGQLRDRVLGKR